MENRLAAADLGRKGKRNMKSHLGQRLRKRRARIEFQRAYDSAGESMRQELMAIATRQNVNR
jgi:hypothetical protein